MTPAASSRVVFTDANVLINLIHLRRLDLLGRLAGFAFLVPEPVLAEVSRPDQLPALQEAIAAGHLAVETSTDLVELRLFAELRRIMGDGEAACLAMAATRNALVATSDKKRRFRREARALLGENRLINLMGLLVTAIRQGILSIEEADRYKASLEKHRFKLNIGSFRELMDR